MIRIRPTLEAELSPRELIPAMQWAVEHDLVAAVGQWLIVPDLVMVEWVANGEAPPPTVHASHEDGRSVYIYAVLENGLGYPIRLVEDQ